MGGLFKIVNSVSLKYLFVNQYKRRLLEYARF